MPNLELVEPRRAAVCGVAEVRREEDGPSHAPASDRLVGQGTLVVCASTAPAITVTDGGSYATGAQSAELRGLRVVSGGADGPAGQRANRTYRGGVGKRGALCVLLQISLGLKVLRMLRALRALRALRVLSLRCRLPVFTRGVARGDRFGDRSPLWVGEEGSGLS